MGWHNSLVLSEFSRGVFLERHSQNRGRGPRNDQHASDHADGRQHDKNARKDVNRLIHDLSMSAQAHSRKLLIV